MTNEEFEFIERNPHDENTVKLCVEIKALKAEVEHVRKLKNDEYKRFVEAEAKNESLTKVPFHLRAVCLILRDLIKPTSTVRAEESKYMANGTLKDAEAVLQKLADAGFKWTV